MQDRSETGAVLSVTEPCQAEVENQLARVLNSSPFRNSTILQLFLRFVTRKTISGRACDINEYTIATEVFGRSPDFNPAADTIVRTQAYRLRLKLDEYYRTAGVADPILIEIPKGHYFPTFSSRHSVEATGGGPPLRTDAPHPLLGAGSPYKRLSWAVVVCLGAFVAGIFVERTIASGSSQKSATPVSGVDAFWQNFLQTDKEPIVAYTNALYLANDLGDFIPFRKGPVGDRGAVVDPAIARNVVVPHDLHMPGPLYFEDDVTGVGDVLAAVAVSNALVRAGARPTFKRGRLLTTYDLESHNVVFIGSPFVNEVLNDIPNRPKFVFTRATAPPLLWASKIQDTAAPDGQPASFSLERAPDTRIIVSDYAVISSLAGLRSERRILLLGGLSTSGTAAAAQFVTSSEGISEMRRRLHNSADVRDTWPAYFEYLLRVQLSRGLDIVRSECIASHFK